MAFIQVGDGGQLGFSVRDPSGRTFTAADSLTAGVEVETDSVLAYQAISVTSPEVGAWVVTSTNPSDASGQDIAVDGFVTSNVTLAVDLPIDPAADGQPVALTATLQSSGGPVTQAAVSAVITAPDASIRLITLVDDGAHGDGQAGDGVYGALIDADQSGAYAVQLQAVAPVNGEAVHRLALSSFTVDRLPDLVLNASQISVTQLAPGSGDSLLVTAKVLNTGLGTAAAALVTLQEGASTIVLRDTISVLPGSEVTVSTVWHPTQPGPDTLAVFIDPARLLMESRYDNDSAMVVVTPALVAVSTHGAPRVMWLGQSYPNPSHGPIAFEFGLPAKSAVSVRVYDVAGRRIRTLLEGIRDPGIVALRWDAKRDDGSAVQPGVYFCELRVSGKRLAKRLVLLR